MQRYQPSQLNSGVPTNLFISNCQKPKAFDCVNNQVFRSNIQPQPASGEILLNPQAMQDKYEKGYYKFPCKTQGCEPSVYTTNDPRLISAIRGGQVLGLDRPPLNGDVRLDQLNTDTSLNNYGQNYGTYADISAGDYTYYVDKEYINPFYEPVITTPAHVTSVLFRDPMGSYKPHYTRETHQENQVTDPKLNYNGRLSFIDDSLVHRQDLLSRQMAVPNQQRWAPRWADMYK